MSTVLACLAWGGLFALMFALICAYSRRERRRWQRWQGEQLVREVERYLARHR